MPNEKARFFARREYFGSLIFDQKTGDYLPFDQQATFIFEKSLKQNLDKIYRELKLILPRNSFDTFVELSRGIGLLDESGKFRGVFLKNQSGDRKLSAPTKVFLSLTRACNLNCIYCYNSSGKALPNELSTGEVFSLLEQIGKMGVFQLRIGGGEPLLREDLLPIIKRASELNLKVELATNATLLNRELLYQLRQAGLFRLKVSLIASCEKSYDSLRGNRSFRKALLGIQSIKEEEIPFYFQMLLMRENLGEIAGVIKMAEKYRAKKVEFDLVQKAGRGKENPHLFLNALEGAEAYKRAANLQAMTRTRLDFPNKVPPAMKMHIFEGFGCACGKLYLHIDPDGEAAPSGFLLKSYPGGNLRQKSLKELWEEGAGFKRLREIEGEEACHKCSYYRSCRGGCRSRAYVEFEDLYPPDPTCLIAYKVEKK